MMNSQYIHKVRYIVDGWKRKERQTGGTDAKITRFCMARSIQITLFLYNVLHVQCA